MNLRIQSLSLNQIYSWVISLLVIALIWIFSISASISLFFIQELSLSFARYLDELLFLGLFFLIGIGIFIWKNVYISRIYPWLFLFILIGTASTLLNKVPLNVALLGFMQAMKPLAIFIAYQLILVNEKGAGRILKGIDSFFNIMPVIAILYMFIIEGALNVNPMPSIPIAGANQRLGLPIFRSIFTNPNQLANMMVFVAFYQFTLLLTTHAKKRYLLFGLAVLGIVLSVRLKPLLFVPLSLIVLYVFLRVRGGRIKRKYFVPGIILGVGLIIIAMGIVVAAQDILYFRFFSDTPTVRRSLFQGAVQINQENYGLGAGFGRYGSPVSAVNYYSPLYYKYGIANLRYATPDNSSYITDQWWSWFLGETGIWGISVYIIIFVLIVLDLRKLLLFWQQKDRLLTAVTGTAIGSIVYAVLIGYAGSFLSGPPSSYYTMSLAGLAFSLHRIKKKQLLVPQDTPEANARP